MSNVNTKLENRGIPPARPLPSQIMHLLELSWLDIEEAARCIYVSPDSLARWMAFKSRDPMPVGAWLVLNMTTFANKNQVSPR